MGADQSGRVPFSGGQIYIEMLNNNISFSAGEMIQGTVHVNIQEAFKTGCLTVGLYGAEETFMRKAHRQGKRTVYRNHTGYFDIVSLVFPIQQFPEGSCYPGQYSYPFVLQLPAWLPSSMMLAGNHESGKLQIMYSLRAQFVPSDQKDWLVPERGISCFSGTRMIYIYRPQIQTPSVNLRHELVSNVGGFCGMNTSQCRSEIFFEKNEYYLGEMAKVRIVCDNSQCQKAVKSFKFKLHRYYLGNSDDGYTTIGSSYLTTLKEPGIAAGEKSDKEFMIAIPTKDEYEPGTDLSVSPDHQFMLHSFSTSVAGKLVNVAYTLKCFVKHEAWNDFGEGMVISCPIKIMQQPMQVVTQAVVQQPQNWQPVVQDQVTLAIPVDQSGNEINHMAQGAPIPILDGYQQSVMEPNQAAWQNGGQMPYQQTAQQEMQEQQKVLAKGEVDPNLVVGETVGSAASFQQQ